MGKNRDEPSPASALFTNPGRFEVWHKGEDCFIQVASLRVDNLLAAMVMTIHRLDSRWQDNPQVAQALPEARSTHIGDVIVSPEGVAYQIANTRADGFVFQPIDFPQSREQVALFQEWRQDSAAARHRDAQALFGDGPIQTTKQSQPMNDNSNDRGGREL